MSAVLRRAVVDEVDYLAADDIAATLLDVALSLDVADNPPSAAVVLRGIADGLVRAPLSPTHNPEES